MEEKLFVCGLLKRGERQVYSCIHVCLMNLSIILQTSIGISWNFFNEKKSQNPIFNFAN